MCTHKNYITLHSHTYMSLRACWFFLRQQKSESLIWPDLCALANLRVTRLQWWMPTSRCWSCHFASHNAGADVMSARLQVTKEHVFCFIHVMSRNYFGSDTDISTYNSTYMNVHIIYVHIYIYHIMIYMMPEIISPLLLGSRPFCGSRRIPPPEFGSFGPGKNGTQSQDRCAQGREQGEGGCVLVKMTEWNHLRYELTDVEIITWSGFLLKHHTWCGCHSKFGDPPIKVTWVHNNHWRLTSHRWSKSLGRLYSVATM